MEEDNGARLRTLQESVISNPDDPSHHFNLGVFLWEQGQDSKDKAAEHFLTSAKLNPHHGPTFRYLGHCYGTISGDTQRALKCFQRAVALNPDDSESGEAMCDMLDKEGKESLEVASCREASERSPRAFWAFRRLGYLQVHQDKYSEAVQSLQHAIRGYPTCADLWEALGLAYQRLGMFTAAVKSYGRAIELEEGSRVFALVESGNIFLMLGSCGKGVDQFRQALEVAPENVSAYYGLASGLLGLSKERINLGAFRWAASLLEEASEVAKAGTCLTGNISCLWKLHGDIQFTYAKCSPWAEESRSLEFDKEAFSLSILSYKQTCYLAALSASRSYQRALHLAPWQANIYTDIAITSDLICSLQESNQYDPNAWQLPEKMSIGGLLLEGNNSEFWVALGCLSSHNALKQHAFIRALHLDVSLAVAWAYLGQLYRKEDEKQLARQAFDCARSIDPSLALPWAGMSADSNAREITPEEAYESCLRAVQILPLAEFQIGLAKLALQSGHLPSSQVYGAIRQAVQRAPHYPESHNLNGLVCEARFDYQSAVAAYRLARFAISTSADTVQQFYYREISINLARSLSMAGNALDAVRECEDLKKEGLLDAEGLQIYALSLWQLGKKDLALSVTRILGAVSSMKQTSATASIVLKFRLLYNISGPESAITAILKMPKEVFRSPKVSFIVSAIHSIDRSNLLEAVVSSSRASLTSNEEISGMHFLISLSKLIKNNSEHSLNFQSGVHHLRKALHFFPNSSLLRNLLGYLLLSSEESRDTHVANRCCFIDQSYCPSNEGLRSAYEVLGAGAIACYATGNSKSRFSFPTCRCQCRNGLGAIQQLQKCLHQEPWNHTARYLLILNILQKAREERFPRHLCTVLERLLLPVFSNQFYSKTDRLDQYQKFQLLLCASEVSLQGGNYISSISHAKKASALGLPDGYLFFAHLQLCRAYAVEDNSVKLREEYGRCLELKTDYHIGWICLKFVESQYKPEIDSNTLDMSFEEFLKKRNSSCDMWMALFTLARGLKSLRNHDLCHAEEFLARACSLASSESCLFLCHGAICWELGRQQYGSQLLPLAVKSLTMAQENSISPLPLVYTLLAQVQGSLGSKAKWERNLCLEWFSWPPEIRPAELFFQMHLLAKQPKVGPDSCFSVEFYQSPLKWVLRAIHLNPSCLRYWKAFGKLKSQYEHYSERHIGTYGE